MPIFSVEIVGEVQALNRDELAARLADETARHFSKPPERTWVRLHYLPDAQYAEGGGGPEPDIRPVFVSVLLAELPAVNERLSLADELAGTIARVLDRPRINVHIFFEPEAKGRVAFGGKLLH